MGRKKMSDKDLLKHEIKTRVNTKTFEKLEKLVGNGPDNDMSALVRNILNNRPLKIFTHDKTLDIVMEELAALRAELRSIGININQITRLFNTYPELRRKEFYAKIAFKEYVHIEGKIDQLLAIISKLSKKWLSE